MRLYAYKQGSQSAKDLATALDIKRIRHNNSLYRPRAGHRLINWGSSNLPVHLRACNVINKTEAVALASNKLTFFNHLSDKDVRIPEWTDSKDDVLEDASTGEEGKTLWLARTMLTGNSGQGIVLIKGGDQDVVDAPLYVKYVPKRDEYRVHVFQGEVLDVQRKARNTEVPDEEVDWQVRNHANGFIFARNEDRDVPDDVIVQSKAAVEHCGLDFGAVDVVWNARREQAYVLEINTAPGLTGTTLDNYVEAFRGLT
jgi:glutathione synthase/RimK-type ligase-like ATP-grasp enzyme